MARPPRPVRPRRARGDVDGSGERPYLIAFDVARSTSPHGEVRSLSRADLGTRARAFHRAGSDRPQRSFRRLGTRGRLGPQAAPQDEGGGAPARRPAALELAENPGRFLSTVQIGI